MSLPALFELAAEYRQQAAQLADLDLDDATLADTLESILCIHAAHMLENRRAAA